MGLGSYQRESEGLPEVHLRLNRGFPMTIKRPLLLTAVTIRVKLTGDAGGFFCFVFDSEHGLSAFH